MLLLPSPTLTALMASYEKAVVFEEAAPNPYRMAKLFCEMQWSNGGLVLLGVRSDGEVTGIDPTHINSIYARFALLCGKLTSQRVKIGTLQAGAKSVVFLVFNTITSHTAPLHSYADRIGRIAVL